MVDFSFIGNYVASLHLEQYFLNPQGLYAILAVVPLIIFYLIKPKPKDKIIPSLMFILTKDNKFMENSFLRRLMNDFLFFLQLLILLILGTAVAMPFMITEHDVSSEDRALVFDVSASMSTYVDSGALIGKTRYDLAREKARDFLSAKNTIIFSSDIPELMVKDGSRGDAENILSKAKPKDTGTNLGDAIQFAVDQLKEQKGRIIVFSDFINSETDPVSIKKVLESKGIRVDFVDVSGAANNVGIIDLSLDEQNSAVFIKNYIDNEQKVEVSIATQKQTITLPPKSVETVSFSTPKGTNKIELNMLNTKDDFPKDNVAYISTPVQENTKILFISNGGKKTNLYYALAANPKNILESATPPIVPNIDHNVYILQNFGKEVLLPETIRKISESVDDGAILIVVGQDDIFSVNFKGLLPVEPSLQLVPNAESFVKILQLNSFTKDVEFGKVSYYNYIKSKDKTVEILKADDNNSTLIAYSAFGNGKVIYYNINDDKSEFKTSLTYPLFWNNMLDVLLSKDTIQTLNYKTGQSVAGKRFENNVSHRHWRKHGVRFNSKAKM